MTLKRKKKMGFLESSASSDVAFLLIIYFIVIAGFNMNKGFLLNLPSKDSTKILLKDDILRAELDEKGAITLQGQSVTVDEARRSIASFLSVNPNLALVLSIDPDASWQSVVRFVELAQSLKVESFSFNMKERS